MNTQEHLMSTKSPHRPIQNKGYKDILLELYSSENDTTKQYIRSIFALFLYRVFISHKSFGALDKTFESGNGMI